MTKKEYKSLKIGEKVHITKIRLNKLNAHNKLSIPLDAVTTVMEKPYIDGEPCICVKFSYGENIDLIDLNYKDVKINP